VFTTVTIHGIESRHLLGHCQKLVDDTAYFQVATTPKLKMTPAVRTRGVMPRTGTQVQIMDPPSTYTLQANDLVVMKEGGLTIGIIKEARDKVCMEEFKRTAGALASKIVEGKGIQAFGAIARDGVCGVWIGPDSKEEFSTKAYELKYRYPHTAIWEMGSTIGRLFADSIEMELMDVVAGQSDRHFENMFYRRHVDDQHNAILGIDLDMAWGSKADQVFGFCKRKMPPPVVTKSFRDRLLSVTPSKIRQLFELADDMGPEVVEAAVSRLNLAHTTLKKYKPEQVVNSPSDLVTPELIKKFKASNPGANSYVARALDSARIERECFGKLGCKQSKFFGPDPREWRRLAGGHSVEWASGSISRERPRSRLIGSNRGSNWNAPKQRSNTPRQRPVLGSRRNTV
jgi:hypothetical protein